jgi:NAD(P)-dependent dehydrogenase (short-subunit alcohol dehydrogenase family)
MSGITNLRGKVAVVTGGASGIGRGIATQLLAEGIKVVIADIEEDALKAAASDLGVLGVRTDVSDLGSVQALARTVTEELGTVHVVCNNAGIGGSVKISDLALSDWRWSMNVNLWGVIHGVQVFLPILAANEDGGHIVNTSSASGLFSRPGLGAYTVTKFGVVGLSEVLAAELAEEGSKVGVSVLCPGFVRSNLGTSTRNRPDAFADGRLGEPDATARASANLRAAAAAAHSIEPEEAGALVVGSIKRGDLYIITDPEMLPLVQERHRAIEEAFADAAARLPTAPGV